MWILKKRVLSDALNVGKKIPGLLYASVLRELRGCHVFCKVGDSNARHLAYLGTNLLIADALLKGRLSDCHKIP